MNGFFKKKYGYILIAGIFIAMTLTYWFGIRETIGRIKAARDDIQQMLILRQNREYQLSRLAEYDAQYEMILRDEKWVDVFTTRDDMIEFVRYLESLAEESDVTVTLETRELQKTPKKQKIPIDSKKTDAKSAGEKNGDSISTKEAQGKQDKKDFNVIDSLPSTEFTYLGLHVKGETRKVIQYLRKVELLPVALDVISLEAIRNENLKFSEEKIQTPASNQEDGDSVLSVEGQDSRINSNPFTVPETIDFEKKSLTNAFELEVTAGLVVYQPKE